MSLIADTLLQHLPGKRKQTPSGWISFNAPCCDDKRQRGGFIINGGDAVSYHCFNCQFKASWQPGRTISQKMNKLMRLLNMGDDTIYSGTVAAAMEGYLLGIPSIALSMSQHNAPHFETAAKVAVELIQHYQKHGFTSPTLLNVNVPDIPYHELQGRVVTRLGKRHKAEPVVQLKTPRNETVYWVGAAGEPNDGGPGTDFYAVANKQVSISPIQVDLTNHQQLNEINEWLCVSHET